MLEFLACERALHLGEGKETTRGKNRRWEVGGKKNFLHGIVDYINRVLARRGLFEESSVEC